MIDVVHERGLPTVTWDVVSGDPSARTTKAGMFRNVVGHARAGSIVIFHINGRGLAGRPRRCPTSCARCARRGCASFRSPTCSRSGRPRRAATFRAPHATPGEEPMNIIRRDARARAGAVDLDRRHGAVARPRLLGDAARALPRAHGEGARGVDRARARPGAWRRSASSSSRTGSCWAGSCRCSPCGPRPPARAWAARSSSTSRRACSRGVPGSSSRATRRTRARSRSTASSASRASAACPTSSSRSATSSCCARAARH